MVSSIMRPKYHTNSHQRRAMYQTEFYNVASHRGLPASHHA
jgi:hypothetical protein